MFGSYRRLVRFANALGAALRSERVHAQIAILLLGIWLGRAGERYGWSTFRLPLYVHAVALGGLFVIWWFVAREYRARREEA